MNQKEIFENAKRSGGSIPHAWLLVNENSDTCIKNAVAFAKFLNGDEDEINIESSGSDTAHDLFDIYVRNDDSPLLIKEAREIILSAQTTPGVSKYKIFIINGFDRIQERTSNLFLKSLEEPVSTTIWILCAKSVSGILPTIRSRCQTVRLSNESAEDLVDYLIGEYGISREDASDAVRFSRNNKDIAKRLGSDRRYFENRKALLSGILSAKNSFYAVTLAKMLSDMTEKDVSFESGKERENDSGDAEAIDENSSNMQAKQKISGKKGVTLKRKKSALQKEITLFYLFFVQTILIDALCIKEGKNAELINTDFEDQIRDFAGKQSFKALVNKSKAVAKVIDDFQYNVNSALATEYLFSIFPPIGA